MAPWRAGAAAAAAVPHSAAQKTVVPAVVGAAKDAVEFVASSLCAAVVWDVVV